MLHDNSNSKVKNISINKFLNNMNMSFFNMSNKVANSYSNRFIAYNFNTHNSKLLNHVYDFLFYSFLSMSSLISKPIFSFKKDKIIIHLFYYVVQPSFLKYFKPSRLQKLITNSNIKKNYNHININNKKRKK